MDVTFPRFCELPMELIFSEILGKRVDPPTSFSFSLTCRKFSTINYLSNILNDVDSTGHEEAAEQNAFFLLASTARRGHSNLFRYFVASLELKPKLCYQTLNGVLYHIFASSNMKLLDWF